MNRGDRASISGNHLLEHAMPVPRILAVSVCFASALLLIGCRRTDPQESGAATSRKRPNVIFLTVDTLRADHIGLYGYVRNTMPTIEAFAKTALVFENAVVPRGVTRPSYASMLTGLYPFRHGVRENSSVLHEDLVTLPEALKEAGYHTAGFVSSFVMIGELSGFRQGFDVYDDRLEQRESVRLNYERTARYTARAIIEWLSSNPPQPFFLFTHFIDPHGPYTPPERFRKLYNNTQVRILRRNQMPPYQYIEGQLNYYDYVDRYDGEISHADQAIGIVIEELKSRELWDESLVVFTADHGESFGEHELFFEHHTHLWEATTHVPLAIRLPTAPGEQRPAEPKHVWPLCSPMDLMPTILTYLNVPSSVAFDGRNLLPVIEGEEVGDGDERALLIEFPSFVTKQRSYPDVYAARTTTHKLIRFLDPNTGKTVRQAVFDLNVDPMEQHGLPLSALDPTYRLLADQLDSMLRQLRDYELPFTLTVYDVPYGEERRDFVEKRRKQKRPIVKTLTTDQARRLRGLGYVQ